MKLNVTPNVQDEPLRVKTQILVLGRLELDLSL